MTAVDKISGSHVEGRLEGDARQRERGRKTGGVHVDLIKNSYLQRTEKHRSLQGIEKSSIKEAFSWICACVLRE